MAQSSNESNVRGIPPFWQNHTVDPPIPWEDWSDLFQLAIIAKENIDIENLLNPSERHHPLPPNLENSTDGETDTQRRSRLERNSQEQRRYDEEETASIKTETKKFNGMRIEEADKKLRSVLYLALGNEGKRIFGQKFTKVKVLQISFKEFWEFLAIAFVRKTNVTFERHKLLNRKQRDRESLEQFWGALAEMAKKCDIIAGEEEWIRDIFINNMKNYDIQRKLLTETLPPREALNVALIDEKGILNDLKLANNFKSNGSSVHKPSNHFNVKREPTLNIERSNNCMKCGGLFSKGHLAVCPAKDTTCTSCKFKGHFTRLCRSRRKNVNIVNTQIVDNTDFNPSDIQDVNTDLMDRECCGVINAWSESGQSENDDYSVLIVTTIFDNDGKELKKLLNIGLGKENQVILNIQVDSASPVSFLKKNVLHELKLRDPYLKIYPVDESTRDLYCGFTDNAINITGKVKPPIFSNGWSDNDCQFFLTEGHERNILGNDNLPKVGIEVSQKHFPHFQTNKQCKSKNSISQTNQDREILNITKSFKNLFLRIGKIKNQMKITHFHEPLKPIQLKGRRVPLHLLDAVKTELNRLKAEGHIKKLENCDEDRFISPIVITCKKDKSIKLALDSKFINKQIYKNKYQMPNIHELVDNVAAQITNDSVGEVWFTNLDLKNAYSQLALDKFTSNQCNFSIVGGDITGTYQFLTDFYGLGDMPNEFQRVMDSTLGSIPFTNCYLDDILISSKGSFLDHKNIVLKILSTLDEYNFAVKWSKCKFFQKEIEWLGVKISKSGITPLFDKSKAIKDLPIPKNLKELRSFFGSINQYIKFVPNLASLGSPLRPLLNKKSIFQWNDDHTKAFEKIKEEIVNLTENTHFDVKRKTRVKTDASHNGLGASLEQLHGNDWKTISFASRFLNPHESKYSTNELELLGVVWAVEHYKNYLYGSDFEAITDHKAILSALSPNHGNKTYHSRLTRWVDRLLPFNFSIKHIAGKDMGFTDLISRIPSGKVLPISHYDEEFVVANINKIDKSLNPSEKIRTTYSAIGFNLENSDYALLRNYLIAAVLKLINSSFPICSFNHKRTEFCTSNCIPTDYSNTNTLIISISNSAFLYFLISNCSLINSPVDKKL